MGRAFNSEPEIKGSNLAASSLQQQRNKYGLLELPINVGFGLKWQGNKHISLLKVKIDKDKKCLVAQNSGFINDAQNLCSTSPML
jgi:hypothetical protein